ncbi:unnamed protein product, partial [Amoebophrya sp. A120]|eukprot:GSA120T00001354001.1
MSLSSSPSRFALWAWLWIAVTMCSSAGAVFLLISEVPPFLRAAWRLWCQFFVQLAPFISELRVEYYRQQESGTSTSAEKTDTSDRGPRSGGSEDVDVHVSESESTTREEEDAHVPRQLSKEDQDGCRFFDERELTVLSKWVRSLPWIALSGCFLGGHFAFWVWSLEHTTLLHSLMCVTSYPLFLHSGKWVLFFCGLALFSLQHRREGRQHAGPPQGSAVDEREARQTQETSGPSLQQKNPDSREVAGEGEDLENSPHSRTKATTVTTPCVEGAATADEPVTPASPSRLEVASNRPSNACSTSLLDDRSLEVGDHARQLLRESKAPAWQESVGIFVSLLGVAVLLLGPEVVRSRDDDDKNSNTDDKQQQPSLVGDLVACVSAICMCFYLLIGKVLRSWCPLFLYTTPVVLVSAVVCTLLSVATEGTGFNLPAPSRNVFGFFHRGDYLGAAIFLGAGAGVGGHTVLNFVLKWMSPMVVSTALLLEPVLGTAIGMLLDVTEREVAKWAVSTLLGVPILLAGLVLLVRSEQEQGGRSTAAEDELQKDDSDLDRRILIKRNDFRNTTSKVCSTQVLVDEEGELEIEKVRCPKDVQVSVKLFAGDTACSFADDVVVSEAGLPFSGEISGRVY